MADYASRIQEVSNKLSNVLVPIGLMASVGVPIYNAAQELLVIVDGLKKEDEANAKKVEELKRMIENKEAE